MAPKVIYRVYNQGKGRQGLDAWWKSEVARDQRSEKPEGLVVLGEEFAEIPQVNDLNSAIKAIGKNVEPYCGAVAVPFSGKVTDKPFKVAQAEEACETASQYLNGLKKEFHKTLTGTKSKTVGCKGCGSQVTRSYVKEDCRCPVCGEILLAATYQERLKNAEKRAKAAESKLSTTNTPYREWDGTCWAIGGWGV